MGEFSIFHWLIVLAALAVIVAVIVGVPVGIYYLIRLVKKATDAIDKASLILDKIDERSSTKTPDEVR